MIMGKATDTPGVSADLPMIIAGGAGRVAAGGWGLIGVAFAAIITTALLGPSAAEAPLGAHDDIATPPWHAAAAPPSWLVTALLAVAVAAAFGALALAITGRWRPNPKRLLAAGVIAAAALAVVPPIGSADPLSYAAYGRMVATGRDPYTTTPDQLADAGDPVGKAVEVPWQQTPSVYGPLVSAEQGLASMIAGDDVALTVLLLDIVGAAAFVGVGLLLHHSARNDTQRRRAAALWAANPLLWLALVAGAHVDVLAAGLAAAAVVAAGRSRLAAGALAGAATAVKAPYGLVGIALLWAARRSRRALAAVALGAIAVAGTGYAVAGSAALHQLSRASRMVSFATPWRPLTDLTDPALGHGASRRLIGALVAVVFVILVARLARLHPEARAGNPTAVAAVLMVSYLLASAYLLPWYDAAGWALLALMAASRLDGILLAHTSVLSLAYIPGRAAVTLHGALHTVTTGMRSSVSPTLLGILLLAVVVFPVWRSSRLTPVTELDSVC